MSEEFYRDPLEPNEREEFEEDLISFCDRQLDLLGDISGLNVLYAGGSSLLWVEGLSHRIGAGGNLVVLDSDEAAIEYARERLADADLASSVNLVAGDVFAPPLEYGTFDLSYSAGLFHELNVAEEPAEKALSSLARLVRGGGRVATTDFINSVPAAQIEDENLWAALANELFGRRLYGIGPPERLLALHESVLKNVRWSIQPPESIRYFENMVFAEEEPDDLRLLPAGPRDAWRRRRSVLRERIRHEGYTRPATLYLEGRTG